MKKTQKSSLQVALHKHDNDKQSFAAKSLLDNIKQGLCRMERMEYELMQGASSPKFNDINTCIAKTCKLIQKQFGQFASIEVEKVDLPKTTLDLDKLSQILNHLLLNAFQAVSKNGKIRINTKFIDNTLTVAVRDNGCGIASEYLTQIFEPTFTSKKDHGGTGLGLAISKDICHDLGGELRVTSVSGEGSEFAIEIPLVSIHLH